ncbi:DUF4292 domain-containing protein [Lutibacter sp. A80]|uniref:DUF4292 domain-containing protein n=1 Tax=Lutibacter sp. A80 TaxID=2918453 RepID=UPI001F06116F|nr:DUF4292 domain-containing protein [Lutibacter sp. A80]UMB59776.1 DUF4292 domain-containing protein [Lutibacter sp. A80]
MKQFSKIVLIFLLIFTSCKSNKSTVDANIKNISTKKIINNHYSSNFDQKTVDAKINAKFKDDKTSVSFSIKLRLEKDKTIWMSATKFGFPVAKVMITPNRVLYYEKMKKTFFDGDFSLLSEWLGTELDYEKVQNILLGQAVLNLKKGKYNSTVTNKLYQLQPKKDIELFGILFFLNSDNFKINKQEISNKEKQQLLTVSYPDYNKIKGEQFPKNINIKAVDHKKLTTIDIEYRTVEFNEDLTFPFSIPNGYKEISLK